MIALLLPDQSLSLDECKRGFKEFPIQNSKAQMMNEDCRLVCRKEDFDLKLDSSKEIAVHVL